VAKKIKAIVKINIPAGKANPAPPIGTALGPHGIQIMEFCKAFNEKTKSMGDDTVPAVVTIFEDRTFTFITKTPPASKLLIKASGAAKGSGVPNKEKVGKVTKKQVEEIAQKKMSDLNAKSLEAAVRIVAGTAKSMGITVE
jgi:large subunit ribosomal protein L11